ncbi:hypothetical protein CBP51_05125 [Cellvibrio mixtus]|uniref:Uncharacterized protein n=1 Tax=Cellvibrio mixtus TaxID=39650 RepID=A0A266Q982_9GAMM|nr:hypothetical protein [Cellvibrio mixtus]OZY86412.1 hypothetical protein CBP51_05125 [Cellvibrio mixtus]
MKNKENTDVFMEDQRESLAILLSLPIPDYVKNTPHTGASLNGVGKISLPSVKTMRAIKRNFNNKWLPNIVFSALVLSVSNMSPVTIYNTILYLVRVLNLCDGQAASYNFRDSNLELNPGVLNSTFQSIIKSSDFTPNAKVEIYNKYISAAKFINTWYRSHEASFGFSRDIYKSLVIPLLDLKNVREDISRLTKKINDKAKAKRKAETDDLFPSFREILAAAHFRLNSYERFYKASKEAEAYILSAGLKEYQYFYHEGECLVYCRLVHIDILLEGLVKAGQDHYIEKGVKKNYQEFIGKNSLDIKNYFLEIENNSDLDSNLFWFIELFSVGAFHPPQNHYREDRERFLKDNGFQVSHFYTPYLIPARSDGLSKGFPLIASKVLDRIFIPHHDFRIIFNLAALATEFISTTGARINEVAQIAIHPDCIKRITIPKVDSLGHVERYVVMLFPKGSEEQKPYFISDETFKLLNRVTNIQAECNEIYYGKK